MKKRFYRTPSSEEIKMILDAILLEKSNTEGIGGGYDD